MSIVEQASIIWGARSTLRRDPHLAVSIVRDLQVTEDAGLTSLAWTLEKYRGSRREIESFLDTLIDHIEEVYAEGYAVYKGGT